MYMDIDVIYMDYMIPGVRFITSLIVIIIVKDVESLTSGAAPWHFLLLDLHKSGRNTSLKAFNWI